MADQKEIITGKLIQMTDTEIETLKTYREKQSQVRVMLGELGAQLESNERKLWRAVRDLYPELHDYDIRIDWEKEQIRVRHKLTDWEKKVKTDNGM
jgi:hypothetical protein